MATPDVAFGLYKFGVVMSETKSPDRNLAMELVRVTEAAAMAAARWMGRGDKEGADDAAVNAMRFVLRSVNMDGVVIIGEGEKDEAPMLYNGEKVGNGSSPKCDVAVDPIDGTTLTSLGRGNAIAVLAVGEEGTMFDPGPCVYMEKIAVGPSAKGLDDINVSPTENLNAIAAAKGESVRDLTAVVLDRPRHNDLVSELREAGARIRLIPDGDVAGAISTAVGFLSTAVGAIFSAFGMIPFGIGIPLAGVAVAGLFALFNKAKSAGDLGIDPGGGPIVSASRPEMVAGDLWINNEQNQIYFFDGTDLTLAGNLTVNGTTVTNSATNTTIEDQLIELGTGNSGSAGVDTIFKLGEDGKPIYNEFGKVMKGPNSVSYTHLTLPTKA